MHIRDALNVEKEMLKLACILPGTWGGKAAVDA